jgi:hypothetical protein
VPATFFTSIIFSVPPALDNEEHIHTSPRFFPAGWLHRINPRVGRAGKEDEAELSEPAVTILEAVYID